MVELAASDEAGLRARRFPSRSSVSDEAEYLSACREAAEDWSQFARFRTDPRYQRILEHFSCDDGRRFLAAIERRNPILLEGIDKFRSSDAAGGPLVCHYGQYGAISPSTIRYVHQMAQILEVFGALAGCDIVEIGGGYGGLCKIFFDYAAPRSYTIVDLPVVLRLVDRWLSLSLGEDARRRVRLLSADDLDDAGQWDLALSFFAFTECVPAVQDRYLSRIIARSQNGLIGYNLMEQSYSPPVLLHRLGRSAPGKIRAVPDLPSTRASNFLVVWGPLLKVGGARLQPVPYRLERQLLRLSPNLLHGFQAGRNALRSALRGAVPRPIRGSIRDFLQLHKERQRVR